MALLDMLKQNLGNTQPVPVSQTPQLEEVSQAQTGKAAPLVTAPRASRIGEQQVQQQVKTQLQQQAEQGRQQAQIIQQTQSQQQQKFDLSRRKLGQQQTLAINEMNASERIQIRNISNKAVNSLKQMAMNHNTKIDSLFTALYQNRDKLDTEEYRVQLEEANFTMALQDKTTIAEINRIGKEKRLSNAANFELELNKTVFGQQQQEYIKQLNFNMEMLDDKLETAKVVADINIDQALQMTNNMISGQNYRNIVTGVTGAVTAGATHAAGLDYSTEPETEILTKPWSPEIEPPVQQSSPWSPMIQQRSSYE